MPAVGTTYRLSHPQQHLAAFATVISPKEVDIDLLDLGDDGDVCRRTFSRPVKFTMSLAQDDNSYAHVQRLGNTYFLPANRGIADRARRVAPC